MKRTGILNADLSAALCRLGHGDVVLVADCGMPAPAGVPVIDLALVHGVPRFEQVLGALLGEIVVDRCVAAQEARGTVVEGWLNERFADIEYIEHCDLKQLAGAARVFVRTGEATAFANAALVCGVSF
ncbi:D-ribose pyranase [Sanguibacter antarcticus]|uniref:D-ribose pyranase n=1 Tax=Sanguibacter antarcticus TaxID=372484 RepID=A0A2A9E933_9MICO|nr:D-ribose pyranase [Sanguibacter antarcticus]PFG34700.1 D-ribose pyranase [Sanguibacter antarcticus]